MTDWPTKRDLDKVGAVVERQARWLIGYGKDYGNAQQLRQSWKVTRNFIENILREAFLKNE